MRKYPIELQDEEKACGAYCILMILKYYHFHDEIKNIKRKARLNHNGISIKGMIECLKSYQIEAIGYQASLEDLSTQVSFPCILYMIYEGLGHFVVLYEIRDDEYIIGDPARGLISLYLEEMQEHYGLHMIAIKHVGRVPTLTYKSYAHFLKETFFSYQKNMIHLIMKGLWIALLGYVTSYFFQIFIDVIHQDMAFFYMAAVSVGYCLMELIRSYMMKFKAEEMIHLQKALDEDHVFQSSMNMLKQPLSFFYQDKGIIQSQLVSLFDLSEMSLSCFESVFLETLSLVIFSVGMLFLNWQMTLLVWLMLGVISVLNYHRLRDFQDLNKNYLEAHFTYQHHLLELIDNHFLIKSFRLLQKERERSYHIYLDEALLKEEQALFLNRLHIHSQYLIYIFYGLILTLGFYFYHLQKLSMGRLLMFYMLMSYCIQPVFRMIALASQYQQVSLIYEKYKAFEYEAEPSLNSLQQPITSIVFDNVGYSYGYQLPVLEHIDLTIQRHLLIKGATGSGKSTLLKLLLGMDLQYSGDIYINQQELRTLDLYSVYEHIGYVNETPTFLHMSLFDNFLCSQERKIKAYLKAFGQEELLKMFHVILSEEGQPLSLGQRQVVAIIRLLCQNYDVLIFDEAFSHMDTRLANKIQRFLLKNDEGKIYIMVNHQTKLVNKDMECVIIEKGTIKNKG